MRSANGAANYTPVTVAIFGDDRPEGGGDPCGPVGRRRVVSVDKGGLDVAAAHPLLKLADRDAPAHVVPKIWRRS